MCSCVFVFMYSTNQCLLDLLCPRARHLRMGGIRSLSFRSLEVEVKVGAVRECMDSRTRQSGKCFAGSA